MNLLPKINSGASRGEKHDPFFKTLSDLLIFF